MIMTETHGSRWDHEYALYLGCVAPNRYPLIEAATVRVFEKLRLKLHDMEGASCCPAPGVFRSFDIPTWLAIGSRNLTIAEQKNLDIAVMCNGCYGTLLETNHQMKHEPAKRKETNKVLSKVNREFKGNIKVRHILDILYNDVGLDTLSDMITNPLRGLKCAVHYGCHLLKPSEIRPRGDSERPTFFDELVEITGAESVDYKEKWMCCGAGGGVRAAVKEVSMDFTREKLANMKEAGVDCIIDACPFCHLQFDLGQLEVKQMFGEEHKFPVIYYTQLLGLAMGLSPYDLGVLPRENKPAGTPPFIPLEPIMEKIKKSWGT